MTTTLYNYQELAVQQVLRAPKLRWVLNLEMGIGKTAIAVESMRRANIKTALIVCPALVRQSWLSELDKWWPGHPEAKAITIGVEREVGLTKEQKREKYEAYKAPIQIVSYELLGDLLQFLTPLWDAIIFDEFHKVKNPLSGMAKDAALLLTDTEIPMVLGLTGTLMPDQIGDVWNPLNLLWPDRFGKKQKNGKASWGFLTRYSNQEYNGYGYTFKGINELNREELQHRLASVSTRVTRQEVAHLLPPLDVRLLPVQSRDDTLKWQYALEWHEAQKDGGVTHPVILTHFKDTAKRLQKKIPGSILITGEDPIKERLTLIEEAKSMPSCTLIATMHSIEEGINNLASFTNILFAELYWRPKTMVQAMMRFPRLNSDKTNSVSIELLTIQGTIDERVGINLVSKIEAINGAIRAGQGEASLLSGLQENKTDEEIFNELNLAMNNGTAKEIWDE